jgi:CBS domain-containing protein
LENQQPRVIIKLTLNMYKYQYMKVGDIMTRDVITAKRDMSLKEAAGLLAKFRVHGLPVVDGENKVIGIIAESDFFTKDESNIFLPTFFDFIERGSKGDMDDSESEKIRQKNKVEDIMTADCVTVKENFEIKDLIGIFRDKNFNSVPVVDDQGALIGIVAILDVIKLF